MTCRPPSGESPGGARSESPGGASAANACSIASTIAGGSAMRPGPNSPHAIGPDSGPTNRTPSSLRRSRLRRVAGCSHILTFIAGAASTRLSVASNTVVAISSARPVAMRARIFALAGAITMRSAARDNSIWPIAASSVRLNSSSRTGCPLRVAADRGEMNCRAAEVITTWTVAPRSLRRQINSNDL